MVAYCSEIRCQGAVSGVKVRCQVSGCGAWCQRGSVLHCDLAALGIGEKVQGICDKVQGIGEKVRWHR